jgi:hypothetical protein
MNDSKQFGIWTNRHYPRARGASGADLTACGHTLIASLVGLTEIYAWKSLGSNVNGVIAAIIIRSLPEWR